MGIDDDRSFWIDHAEYKSKYDEELQQMAKQPEKCCKDNNGNNCFFWVCVVIALIIFILGLCFYNDGPMIIY